MIFEWRTSAGNIASENFGAGAMAPVGVELKRSGTSFTAFFTSDGITWTQIGGAQTVNITTAALAGVAVASNNLQPRSAQLRSAA